MIELVLRGSLVYLVLFALLRLQVQSAFMEGDGRISVVRHDRDTTRPPGQLVK
ncbi:MAG: hypothetical protein ACRD68_12985 [Pyrinomonadaceae bacterium]